MMLQVGSGAMIFVKQIYNAGKGVSASPMNGQSKPMGDEELASMKEGALIFPELYYATSGYKAELLGIEERKDQKKFYKVQVTKGADRVETEYYDVETGLKMQAETKEGMTELSDYKAVDGIMYPHSMTQNMGPQTITMTVTSVKFNSKVKDELFEIK